MSESVIADFVATFNTEVSGDSEPVRGRILLSEKRLVLAADPERTVTIALSSVFDVAVGHVPPDLGNFFDSTVTVAFETDETRATAVIEADDETIEKFSTVLFKALVNGTTVTVQHPARIGGRVTGEDFEPATIAIEGHRLDIIREDDEFTIRLGTVSNFDRLTREIDGQSRPVIAVRHVSGGRAVTTLVALPSGRLSNILGRFIRLEYSDLVSEASDLDLSEDRIELLVTIYSTELDDPAALARTLGTDGTRISMLLDDLDDDGVITYADEAPALTPIGRVIVSRNLEVVNE
ncbi:MAG: CheF family chemotaxis protein [Halococcoides sp.]